MKRRNWKLVTAIATGLCAAIAGAAVMDQPRAESQEREPYKIGDKIKDFKLTDTEGKEHSLEAYLKDGKIVVLEWFNADCPYVVKHHQRARTMSDLYNEYRERGVVWLAINSGAPGLQGAGLDRNKRAREDFRMEYPLLLDEEGTVGRLFGARTTPDMRIITPEGVLVYMGAIDNNSHAIQLGDVNYVREALTALLAGETIEVAETRPYGCSVKYGRTDGRRPGGRG